jgi:hypothetical protein
MTLPDDEEIKFFFFGKNPRVEAYGKTFPLRQCDIVLIRGMFESVIAFI